MVAGRVGATLVVASEDDDHLAQLLRMLPPAPSPGARRSNRRTFVRWIDRECEVEACLVAIALFTSGIHIRVSLPTCLYSCIMFLNTAGLELDSAGLELDSTACLSARAGLPTFSSWTGFAEPAEAMKPSEESAGSSSVGDTAGASFARGVASISTIVSVLSKCASSLHTLLAVTLPCPR